MSLVREVLHLYGIQINIEASFGTVFILVLLYFAILSEL